METLSACIYIGVPSSLPGATRPTKNRTPGATPHYGSLSLGQLRQAQLSIPVILSAVKLLNKDPSRSHKEKHNVILDNDFCVTSRPRHETPQVVQHCQNNPKSNWRHRESNPEPHPFLACEELNHVMLRMHYTIKPCPHFMKGVIVEKYIYQIKYLGRLYHLKCLIGSPSFVNF